MTRPPRYGAPELDVALPSGAQGKTGGKEPNPAALSTQYGRSNDLDVQQGAQQAASERASVARRATLGYATFRVVDGALDEDAVLAGLVYEGASAPTLAMALERPRQERYGILISIDDQIALGYTINRSSSGFEIAAYDIVGAAPLDLTAGTYDVSVLLVGDE